MSEHLWDVDLTTDTTTPPASREEVGSQALPRRHRWWLAVVFAFVLAVGISVAIATSFPTSHDEGGDATTTDEMIELPPEPLRQKRDTLPRGAVEHLPPTASPSKPDFPPRLRSTSPHSQVNSTSSADQD